METVDGFVFSSSSAFHPLLYQNFCSRTYEEKELLVTWRQIPESLTSNRLQPNSDGLQPTIAINKEELASESTDHL